MFSDNDSFYSANESSASSDGSFISVTDTLGDILRTQFNQAYNNTFNVCHINAQSVPSHYSELYATFTDNNVHAILISESWLKPNLLSTSYSLPGFVLIRNDRLEKRGGGVAIYLRCEFRHRVLATSAGSSGTAEFLFLEVPIKGIKTVIGVVYCPPSADYFTNFELVLESLGSEYEHYIIMGDFNTNLLAPHSPRSRKLLHIAESVGLSILPLKGTHHCSSGDDTWLDLILTSNPSLVSCHGQHSAPGFSHHDLIFLTYNLKPKSLKRSIDYIRELCFNYDIIALQETWLLPEELGYLHSISDDFACTGTSAVDTTAGILRGRPFGGVAILWRKSAFNAVSVIPCNNPRVCAIEIVLKETSVLVFNAYMPTDEVCNLVEYTDCLSSVSAIIDSSNIESCYILGDFNAHPTGRFYAELLDFCREFEWNCVDTDLLGLNSNTYTFVSDAHGTRRWLDHCVVTKAARDSVVNVRVIYDVFWSDHYPLVIECLFDKISHKQRNVKYTENKVVWGERSSEQIQCYTMACHDRLRFIDFLEDFRNCCDKICKQHCHRKCIDIMYNDIVSVLSESAAVSRGSTRYGRKKVVVGWNRHVGDAYKDARLKYSMWQEVGKPYSGPLFFGMCEARKIFKSRLRWCQTHQEQIKMDILASHHSNRNYRSFWRHTNRMSGRPGLPVSVGGVSEPADIANLFKDKFQVKSTLGPSLSVPDAQDHNDLQIIFTAKDIKDVIAGMSRGKSPGHDGLSIEHLKYAGPHLPRVLAMFFSCCVSHEYLPSQMTRTIVVPIVKNKTGDIANVDNYRPISLATVISKVLDSLLNRQLNNHVILHDNQFGFRAGLSTESAILSLKWAIRYYTDRKTPVYACFLDLSKAFDLVSYTILWSKLEKAGVPREIVNTLKCWYGGQINQVRWAGTLSEPYGLECGVRQGGLTSPTLFNLYVDELIQTLSRERVGCYIDGVCLNNISYADDMALLSASICGLRRLVAICESYVELHGLVYNASKSEVMVFGAGGGRGPEHIPSVYLNGTPLKRAYKFKYLGHVLTAGMKDDDDIERERRALSVRANMIARRFARCSRDVKVTLFRAYCTSFYTCSLWANYAQKSYNVLRVQFNNAFRILMGLPRFCSASGMFAEARIDCFYATMRKRCASLVHRVRGSPNLILRCVASRLDCIYVNRCCKLSTSVIDVRW